MIDPLADVVLLLQPSARFSKMVVGAGRWHVAPDTGLPFYGVILEGEYRLAVDGCEPVVGAAGDFVLIPSAHRFDVSSPEPPSAGDRTPPVALGDGRYRVGRQDGPTDLRMVVGHFDFASPDAALLVSLLPRLVHVRGEHRLSLLVKLVNEESRAQRPAREVVLSRLLEVLFIEALRFTAETEVAAGLVRGLSDARLAGAIRAMHEQPSHGWTVAGLADVAALSRSAFLERFRQKVGVAPMAYLLTWRMALAKRMLRQGGQRMADIAGKVGYGSASTFSVAFARCVGLPPAQYARSDEVKASSPSTADELLAPRQ